MVTTKYLLSSSHFLLFGSPPGDFFVGEVSISKNSFSLFKHIVSEPNSFLSLFGSVYLYSNALTSTSTATEVQGRVLFKVNLKK